MKLTAVEEAVSWIGELTGVWLDSDGFDFCEVRHGFSRVVILLTC